jgi:hypothetical protein
MSTLVAPWSSKPAAAVFKAGRKPGQEAAASGDGGEKGERTSKGALKPELISYFRQICDQLDDPNLDVEGLNVHLCVCVLYVCVCSC